MFKQPRNSYLIIIVILTVFLVVLITDRYLPIIPLVSDYDRKLEIATLIKEQSLYNLPDQKKLTQGELKGIVLSLDDKYSEYQTTDEQATFQNAVNQKYEGIGVKFDNVNSDLVVAKVVENSPAKQSGVQVGDVLKKVDNVAVDDFNDLSEIVNKIRGAKGTVVKLQIVRNGQEKSFDITRNSVENELVTLDFKQKTAVITIASFGKDVGNKVKEAVVRINEKSEIQYLVIDVRGDTGGLLEEATQVLNCFVSPGQVLLKERNKNVTVETKSKDSGVRLKSMPIYILTDGGTASASEIMAGALQDILGSKTVGQKTFGKGVVQRLITLRNNDTLKLTIAEWLTPTGRQIDKKGIEPDIKVKPKQDSLVYILSTLN
jgi:carboxyl-terminal processing protease